LKIIKTKTMDQFLIEQYLMENQWIIWLTLLWVLPFKGVALWKAAKNCHKWWFIPLLVLNTMAVLEIIYIFFFSKKTKEIHSKNLTKNKKES